MKIHWIKAHEKTTSLIEKLRLFIFKDFEEE